MDKIKPFYTFIESRINQKAVEHTIQKQRAGVVVVALIPDGFDEPRQLLG